MFRKIAWAAMLVCGLGTSARADITIDTFLDSSGATNYLVGPINPLVLPAVPVAIGFSRTTTITVVSPIPPDFNSIGGTIGAGSFSVDVNNSTLGFATLAYTGLANFSTGNGVRLDFNNLNPGNTSTVPALDMPISVTITTGTGTLTSLVNVTGSGAPFPVNLPFASFSGSGNLSNVTGLTIQLNNGGPSGRFAPDFELDTVSITTNVIPAPPAIVLAGLAAPVLLLRRRAGRKAA